MKRKRARSTDRAVDLAVRCMLGSALALPYRWRVPVMGWLAAHVFAPLAGWRSRIAANLDHVTPDMPADERRRLGRAVPDNVGRTLVEIYSGHEFTCRVAGTPLEGPGAPILEKAHREGRPAVLVTGHFGNFDAGRSAMLAHGYRLGALYRPMKNRHFNRHYEAALAAIGEPIFPTGRHGLARLLRHLKTGGMVAILVDVYAEGGADLTFFGQTAPTALSAAELALRYQAPLFPAYAIRQANGLDFRIVVEAPVRASDPETMTQALNDSLESQVRAHMYQWFWIHRRWKPERQRARAAARTGP